MPDYSKTKIYMIKSHKTDQVYIGSTIQTLKRRMRKHISNYNKWIRENKNGGICSSAILLKYDDAYIELIELYPCESNMEKCKREGELVKEYKEKNLCVNILIPGRSSVQWYEDNKEKKKEYRERNKEKMKEYRERNKEKMRKQQSKKYECTCGGSYRRSNKKRHERSKKHQRYLEGL